ncbi:NAD(P)H-dependent oxidoreductase [Chryseobacterium sp. C-71]|uniref:NAD(P)H-dependent oxidoreductase n=1 Tax=Chryseobacterium sp. C-71 TaxID=2893882 RepID=UPI001E2FFCD3|nr:NAD(P)H-dependent oxidoreductase [Chryseobacterium sp. C-71]UFH31548.1 NAD(P)H-dependent oxidoreductase [Chryseobacterium sp. C-71]
MKTLVIVTHPKMEESLINKRWVEELNKFPEKYVVHELYKAYPDEILDIKKEQELIEAYDKIIFQFPFYWFSSPSLLKKWFDEVLLHGWAYGSKSGYKVAGKKVALAISAGVDDEDFKADGKYRYTVIEFTRPFELSFEYIKADYQKPFVYYGMEHNTSPEWIERSVPMYLDFLDNL